MIIKGNNPTHFDSYGRHIAREAYMNEGLNDMVNKCNCNNPTSSDAVQISPTTPMDIKSNIDNTCCCNTDNNQNNNVKNTYSDVTNHALYLKYHNVRIKFVGFVYDGINYIVDLDNRKVLYKPIKENRYAQLMNRITVNCNSLISSYTLSFALYNNCNITNVTVYPNDIENCSITISNIHTHESFILDKQYISYEYFDVKNMLDCNGNIITFVDYSDVFKLTKDDLGALFTYGESLTLIKDILDNIYNCKDLVEVIKKLLVNIRNKYNNFDIKKCDCNNNLDDLLNSNFNNRNDCCNHKHHHEPHFPFDRPKLPEKTLSAKDIAGIYYLTSDNTKSIKLNKDFTAVINGTDNMKWNISYKLNENKSAYDIIVITLFSSDNSNNSKYYYNKTNKSLVNVDSDDKIYKNQVVGIPSIDFDVILNNYIKPSLIISNGDINASNPNITIKTNDDSSKIVELNVSREVLNDLNGISFLFRKNETILESNSIEFCKEVSDISDYNYLYSFNEAFEGRKHDCMCCFDDDIFKLFFNKDIIDDINSENINNIIISFVAKFKNSEDTMINRNYKINLCIK